MQKDKKEIRVIEHKNHELYVNIDDLKYALKEDVAELFQDEAAQMTVKVLTMTLEYLKNYHQPIN